ncbi:MAG: ATP synthase subunit alpha [Candidatus Uhrbacteria bacterium GW2011_GWD2_52_7]|uniref:ATP synthase subunit alpha n=1 Tax=Candidatus Uhrbacteria bacterium GW2011_GWD2_52_7 TaxID=1618989 RepID=A0A0G1ZPZ6_9BACT|nr:MAG: ATP synthase subunit alpha [Candidatus Uhrbacteria bacterium GW2011_GWD2_52_7]
MKNVAKTLKVDLAQFRELEAFAQFATDLDETTKKQIERGRRAMELMKQKQYSPIPFFEQSVVIYALNNGALDGIAVSDVGRFEEELLNYMRTSGAAVLKSIEETKDVSADTKKALEEHLSAFLGMFKK